jgi:hypothetical protein
LNVRALLSAFLLLAPSVLCAESTRVHFLQGQVHGFLTIRSATGAVIGYGESIQTAEGDRVTSQLTMHLPGRSLDEETTVYTQRDYYKMVSDHHIQKGPFFKTQIDSTITANGDVTIKTYDKDGKEKVETNHLDSPPDLSNGLISVILTNIPANGPAFHVGYFAPAGKGRLLQLAVTHDDKESFSVDGIRHQAEVYRLHPELGGMAGVVAPLIGKQPNDTLVYVVGGVSPGFVREVTQLAEDLPLISFQLTGSNFAPYAASVKKKK